MYVCLCNGITDRQLISAADELASVSGASRISAEQVADQLGAGLGCGSCRAFAVELVERAALRKVAVVLAGGATPGSVPSPSPGHDLSFRIGSMRDEGALAHQAE